MFRTVIVTIISRRLTNTCLPGISSSAACLHHHSESSLTLQSFLSDIPKETTLTANKSSKDNSNREIIFESGMKLLRYNQLNRFKEEIPCAKNNQFIERTRDNYFWLLVQEYCKKNIEFHDVLPIFSLYLSLFGRRFDADGGRIVLLDSVQNEKKPAESRLIFSQKTIFHLLNAAFDDFRSAKSIAMRELQSNCNNMRINMRADENSLQADCLENRDDNDYDDDDDDDESDANSFSLDVTNQRKHIYEIILNAIEEHDSPRKKRLFHGAVLLNRGNALEFVDEFKRSDQDISVDDLEYLCRLTENVKEANILASLTKVEEFLPQKDEVLAKIYEILALFYGQQRDLENLKGLCERLLSRRRRLRCYRHALHRIRHFYRCANAAAPPELTQAIARIDPSVRA